MNKKDPSLFTAIESFIDGYKDDNHNSPSVREIAEAVGVSPATACRYLKEMRDSGELSYGGCRNISTKRDGAARGGLVRVPVLGRIACGAPILAEENIEDYVLLPESVAGGGMFILRAAGESMRDIGINDGDLVLVKSQTTAEPGQVAVVLVGGEEATLKRFYPEPGKKRYRLRPENSEMEDIITDSCSVQGVALKVIKDIV